ncbi:MAG: 50S ribosomal protein L21 [Candidatus Elulimicrobiales bacterium]|nr:50S ribosomal protein L21 [Candidatus Elulimicrobiales bacterium]
MTNFAVIQTGGKQYKVSEGSRIKIEKIIGDYKIGDKLSFENVLLSVNGNDVKVGEPTISGSKVEAEIIDIAKHKTVEVVKYKAKSNYHKKNGHRQPYFEIKVLAI